MPESTITTRWKVGCTGKVDSIPLREYMYLPTSFSARLQVFRSVIKNFKARNADGIVKQCHFPFEPLPGMNAGEIIVTPESLRDKLQQCFREKYFAEMMIGRPTFDFIENVIRYLSRSYNKAGELESDRLLVFVLKLKRMEA